MTQPLGAAVLAPEHAVVYVKPNTKKMKVHLRLPTNEVCVKMASVVSWQHKYFRVIKCVVLTQLFCW